MRGNPLRIAKEHILGEKFRLLLAHVSDAVIPIAVLLLVGATLGWVAYGEYQQAQATEYRLLEANARNADVQVTGALGKIDHLLNQIVEARLKNRSLQGKAFAAVLDQHREDNVRLADHSCDCCRIALAAPSEGAPVAFWRHDFDDNIRDHVLAKLDGKNEMRRVSHDEWKIEACPHHGPTLSIAFDNVYHLAWFDNAPKAHGLFYAQSHDEGRTFSAQMHFGDDTHQAGHPDVLSLGREVFLVWKEFDGEVSSVWMMHSHDGGTSWSQPRSVAVTHDASDHPQLASHKGKVWLSWNSKQEGYRLIALEDAL